jgi:hypothetical protein
MGHGGGGTTRNEIIPTITKNTREQNKQENEQTFYVSHPRPHPDEKSLFSRVVGPGLPAFLYSLGFVVN